MEYFKMVALRAYVFTENAYDKQTEPGLGTRYELYSDGKRICLSNSRDRLEQ
jgi:hypothetical protein